MARYFCKTNPLVLFFLVFVLMGINTTLAQQADTTVVNHTVQKGDNLYRISLKYKVTIAQLMAWNNISNPNDIKIGQNIKIYQPKTGDNTGEATEENQNNKNEIQATYPGFVPIAENKEPKVSYPFKNDDSLRKERQDATELVFGGTRIAPKHEEFDTSGLLDITGYISAYYAYYTDSVGPDAAQKFPTLSPYSNEVGLNVIQVSANYKAEKVRGIVTLQWGDMPNVAWSPKYNLVQQANLGVRLVPKLWFDVGYFRTHIGLESVQPRENINSTIAVTTFIEPYYLSGAKLSWQPLPFITLQANAFSQFNGFTENNTDKALGFSSVIDASSNLSITLNTITSDDSPDEIPISKRRIYNDVYLIWKTKRSILGFEFNYGWQKNSGLMDTTATARVVSSLIALKYLVSKKFAVYGRYEYCEDKNGILSGTYSNSLGVANGINIMGATGGIEIKPIPNSYIRFEYRYLKQNLPGADIFYYNGKHTNFRNEFVFSTGFWF